MRIICPSPNGLGRVCNKKLRIIKFKKNTNKDHIICDFVEAKLCKLNETKNFIATNTKRIEYDYIIPKNTQFDVNFGYLFLKKKQIWNLDNSATIINLNHWLNKNLNDSIEFTNNKNSIPFGVGKRECIAQTFATKQISMLIANILLRCQIASNNFKLNMDYEFKGAIYVVKWVANDCQFVYSQYSSVTTC